MSTFQVRLYFASTFLRCNDQHNLPSLEMEASYRYLGTHLIRLYEHLGTQVFKLSRRSRLPLAPYPNTSTSGN